MKGFSAIKFGPQLALRLEAEYDKLDKSILPDQVKDQYLTCIEWLRTGKCRPSRRKYVDNMMSAFNDILEEYILDRYPLN